MPSQNETGAVVQLVRIHACHAWGRGFESRPHRRNPETKVSGFFVFRSISSTLQHKILQKSQKSAKQPSKQRDAPPGKSTAYGSRNPDSTDIGKVHNVDSLSANPGRGPGHMDDTDKKEKSPSIRRALFLSCFNEATFTNLT